MINNWIDENEIHPLDESNERSAAVFKKNTVWIKRGGCEDYISAESLVERIHGLPVKSIEFITEEDQRKASYRLEAESFIGH